MRTISELYEELQYFFLEIAEIVIYQEYELFANQTKNCDALINSIAYSDLLTKDKEKILACFYDIAEIIIKIGNYYSDLEDIEQEEDDIATHNLSSINDPVLFLFSVLDQELNQDLVADFIYEREILSMNQKIVLLMVFLKKKIN